MARAGGTAEGLQRTLKATTLTCEPRVLIPAPAESRGNLVGLCLSRIRPVCRPRDLSLESSLYFRKIYPLYWGITDTKHLCIFNVSFITWWVWRLIYPWNHHHSLLPQTYPSNPSFLLLRSLLPHWSEVIQILNVKFTLLKIVSSTVLVTISPHAVQWSSSFYFN